MKNNRGFSLIELAIFLTIAASLMTGYVALTANPSKDYYSKSYVTKTKMTKISNAIEAFRIINGRLPCPANITSPEGSINDNILFDDENIIVINDIAKCNNSIGSVPTRSLGLPSEYMIDGWGRRFKLHVSSDLCGNSNDSECTSKQYNENQGNLTVRELGISTFTLNAAYVLLSHGVNGIGAFLKSGLRVNIEANSSNIISNDEQENISNSNIYFNRAINNNFDDILIFRTKNQIDHLRVNTETKLITETECESNSATLENINRSQAMRISGRLRDVFTNTEKFYGLETYNHGDEAIIRIMMMVQEACKIYYPDLVQKCPGGGEFNPVNNSCECLNRSWDGNCR